MTARPLAGVRIVEMAGLGPAPFAAMLLSDMGADVIRVDRVDRVGNEGDAIEPAYMRRGRRSIAIDLKQPEGVAIVLDMIATSEALIEGFRPGVMERLGLGPDPCMARNDGLVYGRITGWGQDGPWAGMAGHDIDYLALTGMLHAVGPAERPVPPLNLVGDYGGGAMMLVAGLLAGIIAARDGHGGRLVDAAMTDGAAYLGTLEYALMADGWWRPEREANLLDGGAPYYRTYETADGRHMAVGAIEPQFYADLLRGLEIDPAELPHQHSVADWPSIAARFARVFVTRTRDEWEAVFTGTDACVAPVLSMAEAAGHRHNRARETFVDHLGSPHPGPLPRFGPGERPKVSLVRVGENTDEVLGLLGRDPDTIDHLRDSRVVA